MRPFLVCFALSILACSGLSPAPVQPDAPAPAITDSPPTTTPPPPLPVGSVSGDAPAWGGPARCGTPQILEGDSALQQADAATALDDGMLLCEVRFTGTPPKGRRWDAFGGNPDPALQLNERANACAHNTHDAVLSWHNMTLAAGETVTVTAIDVDLRNDDHAGIDIATFEGFPLDFQGDHFSASCRGLSAEVVAARLPSRVARARDMLSALQQAMVPAPAEAHWGWPEAAESTARAHIEDVAGHSGWQGAEATILLSNEAGLQAQWAEAVSESIAKTLATLPEAADIGAQLIASVHELRCGDGSCDLTLHLDNQGSARTLSPGQELVLFLVSPIGRDLMLTPQDGFPGGLTLDAGAHASLEFRLPFDAPEQGSVLRVQTSERTHLLRIPAN